MLPAKRRALNAHGGEQSNASFPGKNAGHEGLTDADDPGEVGPGESGFFMPTTKPPQGSLAGTAFHTTGINMSMSEVKDFRVAKDLVKPTPETDRAASRYLALAEELLREYAEANTGKETLRSKERGGISHVAGLLDVSQGYLSRVLDRSRKAGDAVVRKAMRSLRVREEYFYGTKEPATYRDFVGYGKEPIHPTWREFIARHPEITAHEREACAGAPIREGFEPTLQFWEAQLFAQRSLLTREDTNRVVEKLSSIAAEAQRRKKTP